MKAYNKFQTNLNILFPLCLMQMLKCIELDEKLKSMDQEITVNPQFVQKVSKYWTGKNKFRHLVYIGENQYILVALYASWLLFYFSQVLCLSSFQC